MGSGSTLSPLLPQGEGQDEGTSLSAQALAAFHQLTHLEGIIPALETSHALAYVNQLAPTLDRDQIIVVNLSGRGDKDMNTVAGLAGIEI